MSEDKNEWFNPYQTDDETNADWDFLNPSKHPEIDLEAVHQRAVREEFKDELIRADQRRANPTWNGDTERDVSRMTRAMAGHVKLSETNGFEGHPVLDIKDTIDPLGWFVYQTSGLKTDRAQENEARDRTGSFLTASLEGLLELEYQAGTQNGTTNTELSPLHQLTDQMQELLYVPPEERNKQNGKRKSQSRFELDSHITLYSPDNRLTHGKKIAPARKYNFQTPAQVTYTVMDHKTNQQLQFEFFPQQYAFYAKRPELAGADIHSARESLAIRDRNTERIEQNVSRAKEGLVRPYFKIKLFNTEKKDDQVGLKLVSEVGGEWGSERINTPDGNQTMYGFRLKPSGIEGPGTFLQVTKAQGGEGHNIRALHRLVRGFSNLDFNYRPDGPNKY